MRSDAAPARRPSDLHLTPPTPPDDLPTSAHHPGLDGLRGLAVLGVLVFHGGFSWASGGFLGVSTFFTLSGFLITCVLLDEHRRTGRIALRDFWLRRLRRLLPASLLALAGIVVFGATVATADQLRSLRVDALAGLGYVANWRFVLSGRSYGGLFATPSPVQHFWSLAIEEQFYAVFPLLAAGLLALGRGSRRILAAVLAAATIASVVATVLVFDASADVSRAYYGTDTRAAELLVGALLALWLRRLRPEAAPPDVGTAPDAPPRRAPARRAAARRAPALLAGAGVTALAATVEAWSRSHVGDPWLYHGGFVAYALASAVVIAAAMSPGPVRALLSWGPLRWLGTVSYGAYLYHWPVFLWLSSRRTGLDPWPLFALRLAVTLALATASATLVEQPVRSGRRLRGRRSALVAPMAVLAVAGAVLAVSANPPSPTFDFTSASALSSAALAVPVPATVDAVAVPAPGATETDESGPHDDQEPPSDLVARAGSAPLRVMVAGDSVALVLGQALERWGVSTGLATVYNVSVAGCGLARGGSVQGPQGDVRPSSPGCGAWAERWAGQLDAFRPDVVMVHSAGWDMAPRKRPEWTGLQTLGDRAYDEFLVREYVDAVDTLGSTGARVVWVDTACMHSPEDSLSGIYDPEMVRRLNGDILPRLAAARPGAFSRIDLFAKVCPGGRFSDRVGGVADARPDGVHFVPAAADWLAAWLGPQLVSSRVGP